MSARRVFIERIYTSIWSPACGRKLQGPIPKDKFYPARGRYFPQNSARAVEESGVMDVLNKQKALYTAAIIAVIGLIIALPQVSIAQATRAKADTVVANFKLRNVDGGFMTNADLKGKVAVVDLFATWCGPCLSEIPRFNRLYEAYKGKDVAIVGIVVESPGRNIESKVRQLGIKYPVLLGDDVALSAFGDVEAFPTTVVITQEGKIYKRYRGAIRNKEESIKQDIESLLAVQP
jgi:thiol-disulfide isomerase/thioredoxin